MALTESTYLSQIELLCDPATGAVIHVFAERINTVEKDGVVIAQSNHRDSFDASSAEGQAILGEALAAALAGVQQAQAALAAYQQG